MPGTLWIPEAETLTPSGSSGVMDGVGGPRATAHVTVSNPGSFMDMHRVLTSKQAESHVLYDMKGDRLGQYFALNRSSRALMGGSGTQTGISHNKRGLVNIQIEICWDPDDGDMTLHPLWAQDRPNWQAFLRAVRSWGISDQFVYRTARTGGDRATVERSVSLWLGDSGGGKWWGHCHYDELESHWDPGPLDEARFFGGATDMALTSGDAEKVFTADVVETRWDPQWPNNSNPQWGVGNFLGYLGQKVWGTFDNVVALGKAVANVQRSVDIVAADAKAARTAAESAAVAAAAARTAVEALDAASATAIADGVKAGLDERIDKAETILSAKSTDVTRAGGPLADKEKGPLKAGLTDDGTKGQD